MLLLLLTAAPAVDQDEEEEEEPEDLSEEEEPGDPTSTPECYTSTDCSSEDQRCNGHGSCETRAKDTCSTGRMYCWDDND